MDLHDLALRDKKIFDRYLSLSVHELSVYNFTNIYIWKNLFRIRWKIIDESLCVFFQDKFGAFLYLSPLAKELKPAVVKKIFLFLGRLNTNPEISRIENAEEKEASLYRDLGYKVVLKSTEYLCRRQDLVQLSGNVFKAKRASVNFFLKTYGYTFVPYTKKDHTACLKLYKLWAESRGKNRPDVLYQGMLGDSLNSLGCLLRDFSALDCVGRVVRVNREIKGFTFGFPLNETTFCILYEITDLEIKGLAQFIFQEFCREQKKYSQINIMDDSGLENLKKVKLSYHPEKMVPAYIIQQKDAQGTYNLK